MLPKGVVLGLAGRGTEARVDEIARENGAQGRVETGAVGRDRRQDNEWIVCQERLAAR